MTPSEFENQSPIKINKWIDIGSEEHRMLDPDYKLAISWFKMLTKSGDLVTDSLGRIWGKSKNNNWYPYHFNIGKINYGYRQS